VGGPLFDKYPGNLLLAGALSACAVGTFLVPLVTSIWLEGAFVILQGVAMGFLDTGGNVMTLFIWGKDVRLGWRFLILT
jgi:FHS family Na+ dependent glucose MFS transporter 1